jgi:hypothetical protein
MAIEIDLEEAGAAIGGAEEAARSRLAPSKAPHGRSASHGGGLE